MSVADVVVAVVVVAVVAVVVVAVVVAAVVAVAVVVVAVVVVGSPSEQKVVTDQAADKEIKRECIFLTTYSRQ